MCVCEWLYKSQSQREGGEDTSSGEACGGESAMRKESALSIIMQQLHALVQPDFPAGRPWLPGEDGGEGRVRYGCVDGASVCAFLCASEGNLLLEQ